MDGIENEILYQLGSIKTSVEHVVTRFEKLENQLIKEHDGFKRDIEALDIRIGKLESLRSNIYAVAAAVGFVFSALGSYFIGKLQNWFG